MKSNFFHRRITKAVEKARRASERKRLAEERSRRGRERAHLAASIGHHILNEVEHGGQCHISSYLKVTPRWAISYYLNVRRRGQ